MPSISVWALRLACVHLAIGFTIGALMLADKGVAFLPSPGTWLAVHLHTVLFGWTVQLVIGVAYWILPTFGARTNRGSDPLVIAAIVLVNLGVLVGAFGGLYGTVATIAYLLQALAAASFAAHLWPRVKAFGG